MPLPFKHPRVGVKSDSEVGSLNRFLKITCEVLVITGTTTKLGLAILKYFTQVTIFYNGSAIKSKFLMLCNYFPLKSTEKEIQQSFSLKEFFITRNRSCFSFPFPD